jgi:hypothetical protein
VPTKPVIFITEGDTDDSFLRYLLEFHQISGWYFKKRPKGKDCGGIKYFREQLKSLRTPVERNKNYGEILLIADNDTGNGFEAAREEIRQANLDSPAEDQFGLPNAPRTAARQSQSLPPVSILMLPWDNEAGCLETLCLRATNQKYSREKECAEGIIECIRATDLEIHKKSKLILRCLLSSICKSDPNTGLVYAWSTENSRPGDIFPLDCPTFKPIVDYLR